MTEKRYGLTEDGELIDNELGSVYMVKGRSALYLCNELNHLHEENQSLKEEKEYWKGNACNNINFVKIEELISKLSDPG